VWEGWEVWGANFFCYLTVETETRIGKIMLIREVLGAVRPNHKSLADIVNWLEK
jgi:hypothetical protein